MAFPTIPTAAAGRLLSNTQANTTATRTFPDLSGLTKNAGDLLIAVIVAYNTSTGTDAALSGWTGGFTEFADRSANNLGVIGAAYKWSTGAETGTFAVTQAATITGHAAMIVMSIPGAHTTTIPEAGTKVNDTAAAANPLSLDPTGWGAEDTLWIAVGASYESSTTSTFTGLASAPANYGNYADTGMSADAVGAVEGAVAFRQNNASSEDAAGFSVDLSNARNSALVIAVRPMAAATTTSVAEVSLRFGGAPDVNTGHVLHASARKQSGNGAVTLNVALYEGANNRSGDLASSALTTSLAQYDFAISEANAANITDYSNLGVRFWGTSATGDTSVIEVAEVWLETPIGVVTGQAAIAATAVVGAAGTVIAGASVVTGQAQIAATAAVDVVARRVAQREVSVDATASVAAAGARVVNVVTGQADITTTASATAAGARVPVTITGQAQISATADVSAASQRVLQRAASLDATTSVAAAPQRTVQRQVAVDVTATINAAGIKAGQVTGQALLNATASVDASRQMVAQRQASLDATASVQAVGRSIVVRGVASLSATADVQTGSLYPAADLYPSGSLYPGQGVGVNRGFMLEMLRQAAIAATASVDVAHQRVVQRQATIAATSSVNVAHQRVVQRQAAISATADVVAAGARLAPIVTGQAQVAATATVQTGASGELAMPLAGIVVTAVTSFVVPGGAVTGSASLDATASVQAAGARVPQTITDQAQIAATAAVDAVPQRTVQRQVALNATADITTAGARVANIVTGQATLSATADVVAAPQRTVQRATSLDATAVVDASGIKVGLVTAQAQIAATAAVDVVSQRAVQRQTAISATADVAADGSRVANVVTSQAELSATADAAATPQRTVQRAASLDATTTVTAAGIKVGLVTGQASISATGSVSATSQRIVFRQVSVDATTSVVSSAVGWSTVSGSAEIQSTATVASAGVALQVLQPFADSVDNDWMTDTGGTNLVGAISESVPDDGTYIHSGASSPSTCRVKLSAGQIPIAGSRVLRLRAGNEAPGADLTVRLREGGGDVVGGGALVNEFVHTDIGSVGLIEDTVTGTITDYGDLYVELEAV